MNTEQLKLKTLLDFNSLCWLDLSPSDQAILRNTLRPQGSFTENQIEFLKNRWLLLTEQKLQKIQKLLPTNLKIPVIEQKDKTLTSAYLLTSCIEPEDTYYSIVQVLVTCPIVYLELEYDTEFIV